MRCEIMKVELVYDKRNVKEIPGANELILAVPIVL